MCLSDALAFQYRRDECGGEAVTRANRVGNLNLRRRLKRHITGNYELETWLGTLLFAAARVVISRRRHLVAETI